MPFFVQAAVVILSVLLAGQLSRRLGQPAVLGQLLVGVLVGPALLGWVEPSHVFTEMAEVGVVLLMFMAGLETDYQQIRRNAAVATMVAVGGVVLPFLGGWGLAAVWGYPVATAMFIGVLLVATSVSISAQTLRELGKLSSRSGSTILAAAVLDDVLGIVVLSLVLSTFGTHGGGHGSEPLGILLVKMLGFFAVGGLLGWQVVPRALKWVSRFEAATATLAAGITLALTYAYFAELAGLAGIIGAYLIGLMLSLTEFRKRLLHEVEVAAYGFFVPFFFVSVGLTAEITGMTGSFLLFVTVLVLIAIVTKLVGAGLGAVLGGFSRHEAMGVGAGMVARGEVGLIVAAIGLEQGLVEQNLYTAAVFVCLATTLVTPPLLKVIFSRDARQAG